jgi:hypothetical protein
MSHNNKPRGLSDGRLQKLWRQAVISIWRADPLSGERRENELQCHHLVFRRYFLTRHDWRNGVPLSAQSHIKVHGIMGNAPIIDLLTDEHRDYLTTLQRWTKKDYLMATGMSEEEFLRMRKHELEYSIDHRINRRDPSWYALPDVIG